MLDVTKFLRGLGSNSIQRKDFLAEIQSLVAELNDTVIPTYYAATTRAKLLKWNDNFCKQVESTAIQELDRRIRSERNFASIVHANLQLVAGLMQHVSGEVEKRMADRVLGDELPLEVVSMLSLVNDATFLSRFAMDLMNVMLGEEGVDRDAVGGVDPQPPVMITRVKATYRKFFTTLKALAIPPQEYDKKMRQLENLRFNKKTWAVLQHDAGVMTNMISTPVSGFYWSPIFVVRKVLADWQDRRYEAALAKRTEIEMMIQVLEEKQAKGHDNPQIQSELSYARQRVAKLDREIARTEEDLNED